MISNFVIKRVMPSETAPLLPDYPLILRTPYLI
jgi:hypothetical protein